MFSRFFLHHPRFAFVLAIVLSLCGGIALVQLPVEEYPEIAPASIRVSANYPGASAQVVADAIAAYGCTEIINSDQDSQFTSNEYVFSLKFGNV